MECTYIIISITIGIPTQYVSEARVLLALFHVGRIERFYVLDGRGRGAAAGGVGARDGLGAERIVLVVPHH